MYFYRGALQCDGGTCTPDNVTSCLAAAHRHGMELPSGRTAQPFVAITAQQGMGVPNAGVSNGHGGNAPWAEPD